MNMLPTEEQKAQSKIRQLEMHNNILRSQNDRVIKERDSLKIQMGNLRDQVGFWRKHCAHILQGKPVIVKAIAWGAFDPRKHCLLCESDWESLVRFRKRKEKGEIGP